MNRAQFYKLIRDPSKCGTLKSEQIAGFEALLDAAHGLPLSHAAYMLATAWHETARTMQPVREAYWLSETWRRNNLRYWPWYGRGFVQITWEFNYKEADQRLAALGKIKSGELLANADLAMRCDLAAWIARDGMQKGWFTGVSLAACLPPSGVATRVQYMNARTIINGRDKADLVEDYAQWFEYALRYSAWDWGL